MLNHVLHWYHPLQVRLGSIICGKFRAAPHEEEIVRYAIQTYGHLLTFRGEGSSFTFAGFADRIQRAYDCRNSPRNAEVFLVLMRMHLRNPYEPQEPLAADFRDLNGNAWCAQWVDSYNHFTEIINQSGDGIVGSLSEKEREFFLDQRHRHYQQCANLARRAA